MVTTTASRSSRRGGNQSDLNQNNPPVELVAPEEDQVDEDEDEDNEEEDSSDGEPIVLLLDGREKRVNAGNRMRALLDEEGTLEVEEEFREEANDVEFVNKDEEDIFDSDFGSTDEGSAGEEDEEKRLEREAKEARREARGKKKKSTHTPFLPSFARQTKASRAVASGSNKTLDDGTEGPPMRRKRGNQIVSDVAPRESSRKSAVAFKQTVTDRLQETEKRRASFSKPPKKVAKALTQADLISEALETEDINRASLLAFYAAEEDRLATERLAGMRYEIKGPKVTFLSRSEGGGRGVGKGVMEVASIKGKEKEKQVAENIGGRAERGRRRLIEVIGEAGKQGWRSSIDPVKAATVVGGSNVVVGQESTAPMAAPIASTSTLPPLPMTSTNGHSSRIFDIPPSPKPVDRTAGTHQLSPTISKILVADGEPADSSPWFASTPPVESPRESGTLPTSSTMFSSTSAGLRSSSSSIPASLLPPLPAAIESSRTLSLRDQPEPAAHTRNYLIVSNFKGTKAEELGALFGYHSDWAPFKVIPARERTTKPKTSMCPITGLEARYFDPRSQTPYANIEAYRTLTALVEGTGEYQWSDTSGIWGSGKVGLGGAIESERHRRNPEGVGSGKEDGAATKGKRKKTVTTTTTAQHSIIAFGTLPPLPSTVSSGASTPVSTPGAMMTTMSAGQAVMGAGARARAKKVADRTAALKAQQMELDDVVSEEAIVEGNSLPIEVVGEADAQMDLRKSGAVFDPIPNPEILQILTPPAVNTVCNHLAVSSPTETAFCLSTKSSTSDLVMMPKIPPIEGHEPRGLEQPHLGTLGKEVHRLMEDEILEMPSSANGLSTSTHTAMRILVIAAGMQRRTKFYLAPGVRSKTTFTMACSRNHTRFSPQKCGYEITIGRVKVGGEYRWKITSGVEKHKNHPVADPVVGAVDINIRLDDLEAMGVKEMKEKRLAEGIASSSESESTGGATILRNGKRRRTSTTDSCVAAKSNVLPSVSLSARPSTSITAPVSSLSTVPATLVLLDFFRSFLHALAPSLESYAEIFPAFGINSLASLSNLLLMDLNRVDLSALDSKVNGDGLMKKFHYLLFIRRIQAVQQEMKDTTL